MLEFSLCQERQEEIRRSNIVFYFRDQYKGDDECVKDFKSGYCDNIIFDSLGILI
jgi:hypothetical protein